PCPRAPARCVPVAVCHLWCQPPPTAVPSRRCLLLARRCLTPLVSDTPHGRAITPLPAAYQTVSDTFGVRHPHGRAITLLPAACQTVSDTFGVRHPHGRAITLLHSACRSVSDTFGVRHPHRPCRHVPRCRPAVEYFVCKLPCPPPRPTRGRFARASPPCWPAYPGSGAARLTSPSKTRACPMPPACRC